VELDAPRAFARWIDDHRGALGDAIEHGTWLDRTDAETLLDLPVPGVDELVGLLEIATLAQGYDVVVVDTAPTGHALRLIAAPHTVRAVAGILDALQEEHRLIRERLVRVGRPEAADRLIELIAQQANDVSAILRDSRRTMFHWVTLPERLSIAESADGIAALTRDGVTVNEIIVNRIQPDGPPCPLCDARRREERRMLGVVRRSIARGRQLRAVPALMTEPRGRRALAAFARHLVKRPSIAAGSDRSSSTRAILAASGAKPAESIRAVRGASLIFVGGKGGVGKTTVAAALAIRLARHAPDRSVLLLSTDPAHSLADVLDAPVGDEAAAVRGAPANLVAREVDAARAFEQKRQALHAELDDVVRGLDGLLSLAPPGIDELFGMMSVVDARTANQIVVVDTAPTGHALRLLQMPETAREWVQVLLRLMLKYRAVVRPGQLAAELVGASQSIRDLHAVLRDRKQTRVLVVTRAAALPRAETVRLMRQLRSLALPAGAIIVNARTIEPGRCRRCRRTAAAERAEVAALGRASAARGCAIIQTPLVAPPPRGAAQLDAWARTWMA
jgi:arsenite-transporting ATPase